VRVGLLDFESGILELRSWACRNVESILVLCFWVRVVLAKMLNKNFSASFSDLCRLARILNWGLKNFVL
ncbi:11663_t:CDS:2, partial [Racocetra persica]